MQDRIQSRGHLRAGSAMMLIASLFLLASCGPPAPATGPAEADEWYCFAMDRTGQKWAHRAPSLENAGTSAMAACKQHSLDPSSCQMPEDSNCWNTGMGGRID